VLAERREGKGALECAAERVRACVCARTRDVPETATTPVAFLGKGMRTVAFGWTFRIGKSAFDRTRRVGAWVLAKRVQLFLRSRSKEYFQVFLGHASIPARRAGTERYRPCRSLSSVIAVPRTDDHDAR
jgi:hypothetical protein